MKLLYGLLTLLVVSHLVFLNASAYEDDQYDQYAESEIPEENAEVQETGEEGREARGMTGEDPTTQKPPEDTVHHDQVLGTTGGHAAHAAHHDHTGGEAHAEIPACSEGDKTGHCEPKDHCESSAVIQITAAGKGCADSAHVCCTPKTKKTRSYPDQYGRGQYGQRPYGGPRYDNTYNGKAYDYDGALKYGVTYLGDRDNLEKALAEKDLYAKPYTNEGLYNEYLSSNDRSSASERKSVVMIHAIKYLAFTSNDRAHLNYVLRDLNRKYKNDYGGNYNNYSGVNNYDDDYDDYGDDDYAEGYGGRGQYGGGGGYGNYSSENRPYPRSLPATYQGYNNNYQCQAVKYRSHDGRCNNLAYPNWGRAFLSYNRLLPPRYGDGISSPRRGYNGYPLPSARQISTYCVHDESHPVYENSLWVMQWGQFSAHDIGFTPVYKAQGRNGILCCNRAIYDNPKLLHPECYPIQVPQNDYFYSKHPGHTGCMEFVRSLAGPAYRNTYGGQQGYGSQERGYGNGYNSGSGYGAVREQLNQVSSFVDGSQIYGTTEREAKSLRSYKLGYLITEERNGRHYIPVLHHGNCSDPSECYRVLTGDPRGNMHPWLTATHTLFLRYHNYIARELYRVNPNWDDEYLYQEARRIVGATLQHITYYEFLPRLLGKCFSLLSDFGGILETQLCLNDSDLPLFRIKVEDHHKKLLINGHYSERNYICRIFTIKFCLKIKA